MAKRKARGFLRYKSYSFREKDPIIDAFRTLRQHNGATYREITEMGGPSAATIRNWEHGDTRRPQFSTVWAAARCCGASAIESDRKGYPRFVNDGGYKP